MTYLFICLAYIRIYDISVLQTDQILNIWKNDHFCSIISVFQTGLISDIHVFCPGYKSGVSLYIRVKMYQWYFAPGLCYKCLLYELAIFVAQSTKSSIDRKSPLPQYLLTSPTRDFLLILKPRTKWLMLFVRWPCTPLPSVSVQHHWAC